MTNKIDLNSIPSHHDCHRVPVGATVPAGTFYWAIDGNGMPYGEVAESDWKVVLGDYYTYLTAEPISAPIPEPTPEDSPIIASGTSSGVGRGFTDAIMSWAPRANNWAGVADDGYLANMNTADITSWSPAVVTPTGHGVMDDRDKRDRMDALGNVWRWEAQSWAHYNGYGNYHYSTLQALSETFGQLTFADEEDDR